MVNQIWCDLAHFKGIWVFFELTITRRNTLELGTENQTI